MAADASIRSPLPGRPTPGASRKTKAIQLNDDMSFEGKGINKVIWEGDSGRSPLRPRSVLLLIANEVTMEFLWFLPIRPYFRQ